MPAPFHGAVALQLPAVHAEEAWYPRLFTPQGVRDAMAPVAWLGEHFARVSEAVQTTGAALLRGFAIDRPETFTSLATRFAGSLGDDYEGPSPRQQVARGAYTASEVPGTLSIPEHAEMSYLPRMTRHLFFWCQEPARSGGATTLVDGRRVLAALDEERIAPLLAGPLQIRRRHAPASFRRDPFELKPWNEMFATRDRGEALARASAFGFAARFEPSGALTLEHEQPAVRHHPETGARVWLNHLLVFHASAPEAILLGAARRDGVLGAAALYPAARAYRRLSARLGRDVASDVRCAGEPIADEVVAHVRGVIDEKAVLLDWRKGDLVIVDNHLVLHGRRPFRGPRRIAVAWSSARA
jgi:alpha-ketoglutarate-dependent taurine dioxygenase